MIRSALALALFALASGCSPAAPPPTPGPSAAPVPSATAAPPGAPAPQASAPPAPPPQPPKDPLLDGLSDDDADWAKQCLAGKGSYCTRFGNAAELVQKDFERALVWYRKGCAAAVKEPVCCMGVARLTLEGKGTTADVAAGLTLWAATCALPHRESCDELAQAFESGSYGLPKDPKRAKELYAKACELKSQTACKRVGKAR